MYGKDRVVLYRSLNPTKWQARRENALDNLHNHIEIMALAGNKCEAKQHPDHYQLSGQEQDLMQHRIRSPDIVIFVGDCE